MRRYAAADVRALERLLASIAGDEGQFEARCGAIASWGALPELAERHGVLGVVERALRASRFAPLPGAAAELRRRAAVQRLAQSHLVAASDEVLAALDAAGVPAVALKGPVLGERLHGDPTLRVATDLDVMVALDRVPDSLDALRRLGYRASPGALSRIGAEFDHHLKLHRPAGPQVELHYRLSTMFGVAIPSEGCLARSGPHRTAGGAACRVLSREDELVFLAIHAAAHLFARLAWLYDLKVLLGLPPAPDWGVARARAGAQGVGRAFAFALRRIANGMEVPLPAEALGPPYDRPMPAADGLLAASARSALFGHGFRAALCDGPAIATAHVCRRGAALVRRRLGLD